MLIKGIQNTQNEIEFIELKQFTFFKVNIFKNTNFLFKNTIVTFL